MNAQNQGQGLGTRDVELGNTPETRGRTFVEHVAIVLGSDGYPVQSTYSGQHSSVTTGYGSTADLLIGMLVGFLVPWFPVLLGFMDNAVTNRSFMLGLLSGVAGNLSLGCVNWIVFDL